MKRLRDAACLNFCTISPSHGLRLLSACLCSALQVQWASRSSRRSRARSCCACAAWPRRLLSASSCSKLVRRARSPLSHASLHIQDLVLHCAHALRPPLPRRVRCASPQRRPAARRHARAIRVSRGPARHACAGVYALTVGGGRAGRVVPAVQADQGQARQRQGQRQGPSERRRRHEDEQGGAAALARAARRDERRRVKARRQLAAASEACRGEACLRRWQSHYGGAGRAAPRRECVGSAGASGYCQRGATGMYACDAGALCRGPELCHSARNRRCLGMECAACYR